MESKAFYIKNITTNIKNNRNKDKFTQNMLSKSESKKATQPLHSIKVVVCNLLRKKNIFIRLVSERI